MPDELELLVHRLRSGIEREESARRLDVLLRPRLRRFYLSLGFSSTEAEDLVQQSPDPRLSTCGGSAARRSAFSRGSSRVARNLGYSAMRDRRGHRLEQALDADLEAPGRDQESAAREARERIALVERLLRELPEQQRRCLVLVVRDELSYAEVGDLLGLSFR